MTLLSAARAPALIASKRSSNERASLIILTLTAAFLALALAPLFVVEIPAMLDYPNHLARMYLLAGPANAAYETRWALSTNMAMDAIVPALARWMAVPTATKVFLGCSQVLFVTGAMALEQMVKGRQRLAGPSALLVLFSLPFAWGELNLLFGMSLALWGFALWIGLRDRAAWVRWAAHALVVAALFATHLFDLGVYGLAIGLYELSRLTRSTSKASLLKLAVLMVAPVLLYWLAASVILGGAAAQSEGIDWDFGLKVFWPLTFLNVYDLRLSLATGGAMLALVTVLLAIKRLTLTPTGLWLAAGFVIIYLALPRQLFGSLYLDVRLLTAAAVVLPPFMATRLTSRAWRIAPLAMFAAVIIANDTSIARAWISYQRDYREFEGSFAQIAPGSAVLIGQADSVDRSYHPAFYSATLAAPRAGAFVSSLYATTGMQPVRPRPRFQGLAVADESESLPPRLAALRAAASSMVASQANIAEWPARYQYLYLVGFRGPNPMPNEMTQIATGRRFTLYRVGRR